jgi:hypothetical protein
MLILGCGKLASFFHIALSAKKEVSLPHPLLLKFQNANNRTEAYCLESKREDSFYYYYYYYCLMTRNRKKA